MSWRAQINDKGVITRYKDVDTGEVISAQDYARRAQMQTGSYSSGMPSTMANQGSGIYSASGSGGMGAGPSGAPSGGVAAGSSSSVPVPGQDPALSAPNPAPAPLTADASPLIQPGAQMLTPGAASQGAQAPAAQNASQGGLPRPALGPGAGETPTAGQAIQGKNLRLEGLPPSLHQAGQSVGYKTHGFLDATSIAILLPTLVLLALIIAAAHKKRLFPWQTIRTFNPPSGLMSPRDYERSFLCPPNLRRHGRLGKRNPNATWTDADGVVVPFGFLARTHLPITIPIGRLPNKNMFIVAPSGSGKTTLMRAIIKALLAKPCVIIALEAKANDPNLDSKKEGFKYSVLPEAQHAGFDTLYFNPLDKESIHWNPLDVSPIVFASSIVQDVNSLPPEEQHWAERDHGYIAGLAQLLKWGAVQVVGEDENGVASRVELLNCNTTGLMRLVNNRRNIVESLRRLKNVPEVPAAELSELTQTLSSIIRTDTDWDKNIQGVRGRLRMFKNPDILHVTEQSNVDLKACMHKPTVLIFGAPASLGPDAESLASCFVYQLQQALHTRYGTANVLPLFAFFDEYQTLNMDIAGRLSAIVRGANGGLAVILQNISQVAESSASSGMLKSGGASELKTIFSNAAIRVCLHNADETTAKFFSDEIGKHAVVVPGISDHYQSTGFGIFPSSWNRIHSQQVVARVDPDSIKRMEKHHALVYLSPAGDPEFGEAKPLMVDLRGIEEIARLHLLHNVSARRTPPGVAPPPGIAPGGPVMPVPGPDMPSPLGTPSHPLMPVPGFGGPSSDVGHFGQMASMAVGSAIAATAASAATNPAGPISERVCPKCGHGGGNRKFCIQCGTFLGAPDAPGLGAPGAPSAQPQTQLETSAVLLQGGQAQPQNAQQALAPGYPAAQPSGTSGIGMPAYPLPNMPAIPQNYANPQTNAPSFPGFARPAMPGQAMPAVDPSIVSGAMQQPRRAPLFDGPLQIAEAAQQSYSNQRQPMTSFTPDLSRMQLPQGVAPIQPDPNAPKRPQGPVEF
jgi:Type IV secretory system Conjugative DNA transfer